MTSKYSFFLVKIKLLFCFLLKVSIILLRSKERKRENGFEKKDVKKKHCFSVTI